MGHLKKAPLLFFLFLISTATAVSQNLYSATDSVVVSTINNNVSDWGRGFRFTPTQPLYVDKLGKRVPGTGSFTWVIWDVATQTKVHEQVSMASLPTQYIYEDVTSTTSLVLTAGKEYIMELYGIGAAGYYYGASSQIGQHLIYSDQRFCSCGPNTFPTSVLINRHYGTVDFLYSLTPLVKVPNDAAVVSIDSIDAFCGNTSQDIYATVGNFGSNVINSLNITLEVNGVFAGSGFLNQPLDTIGGSGINSVSLNLGSYFFQSNTPYDIKVYTSLPNGVQDAVNINDTVSINVSEPSCKPVQSVMVNSGSATSATIAWVPGPCGNGNSSYIVQYGLAGFTPGGSGSSSTTFTGGVTTATLTGLSPATMYDAYVQEICTFTDSSPAYGPTAFSTPCVAMTTSLSEGFETVTSTGLPVCWENGAGDFDWTQNSGGTSSGSTGPTAAFSGSSYMYTEATGNSNKTAIMISPVIDLSNITSPAATYYYHMYGAAMGTLNFEVEAPSGSGTWASLATVSGNQGQQWLYQNVSLSAYSTQTVRFRFRVVIGSGPESDVAIDEFSVGTVTGIDADAELRRSVSIYPNPTDDVLNIAIDLPSQEVRSVSLLDLQGKVLETSSEVSSTVRDFDLGSYAKGVYIIRVITADNVYNERVVLK